MERKRFPNPKGSPIINSDLIGGILTSAHFYYKLSQELNEDMEYVVESFVSIQRQINSLASVALQNRRALDLLTAEKGGTCLFLGEKCCYFVNETGIVQGRVKELRDRIERHMKELQNLYIPQNLFQQILPWLLPFLGPLVLIILFLLFGPCLFNLFQRFLQEWIRAISQDQVKTILLLESLTPSSEKGDLEPQDDPPFQTQNHCPYLTGSSQRDTAPFFPFFFFLVIS